MVSSGQVTGDLNTLIGDLTNYSSYMGDMASGWKGPSYDNLNAKAEEFVNEYKSAISESMNAFASACSKYEDYMTTKSAYETAKANYDAAVRNKDDSAAARYAQAMVELEAKMQSLKAEITEFLAKASSNSLSASAVSIATPGAIAGLQSSADKTAKDASSSATSATPENTRNSFISSAIDTAKAIASDNRNGYSQPGRWSGQDFDCSSYVISCWEAAGVPVKSQYGAATTSNMKETFQQAGFKCYSLTPGTTFNLQPGDVLLNEGVHTALYVGNNQIMDATSNPADGDKIGVRENKSDFGWNYVLRYEA